MAELKTGILLIISFVVVTSLPSSAAAQQNVPHLGKIDSVGTKHAPSPADSAALAKQDTSYRKATQPDTSHAGPDTLGRMSTPSLVGTLDRTMDTTHTVTREDIHWIDYQYLGNVLEQFPGVYIRDLASTGQYNQINVRGQDWRSVAVFQNGRLLNDPASGIYNLYQYSTENADRIEFITGPRAFLYGINSTGGAVNIVTRNYNSNRPFTKLN